MSSDWVIGVLAGLLFVHFFVVMYVFARRGDPRKGGKHREDTAQSKSGTGSVNSSFGTDTASRSASQQATHENGIECPVCRTLNEPFYRYCRQCVNELPTPISTLEASSQPRSRRMF